MTNRTVPERIQKYLEILQMLDEPVGNVRDGEIEIITDPEGILEAEHIVRERYREQRKKSGADTPCDEWATVGILDQDQYLVHLRDAVKFPHPSGNPVIGTYLRVIYANALKGNLGISILVINHDGSLVLNRAYRHALRSWSLETPGTIAKDGESPEQSVSRCVRDELGVPALSVELISEHYVPERGILAGLVPIYLVRVDTRTASLHATDPTIGGHMLVTRAHFEEFLSSGFVEAGGFRHLFCDGYTIAAYTIAKIKKMI